MRPPNDRNWYTFKRPLTVVTRSGKVYSKGKFPQGNEDFRIKAITDTNMRLVFE